MRSLLSLEQIAEIKTKRQETPSAPREPWLSHENLYFPSQVETTNRLLCQTREEADKRRIFFWRLLVVNEMEGNELGKICICRLSKGREHIWLFTARLCTASLSISEKSGASVSRSRERSPALRLRATVVRCSEEARKKAANATCDPCCIIVS